MARETLAVLLCPMWRVCIVVHKRQVVSDTGTLFIYLLS